MCLQTCAGYNQHHCQASSKRDLTLGRCCAANNTSALWMLPIHSPQQPLMPHTYHRARSATSGPRAFNLRCDVLNAVGLVNALHDPRDDLVRANLIRPLQALVQHGLQSVLPKHRACDLRAWQRWACGKVHCRCACDFSTRPQATRQDQARSETP